MKSKNGRILYDYAKTLIPGGTTLFSKIKLHLPDKWPAYFKLKNHVRDLNGKIF